MSTPVISDTDESSTSYRALSATAVFGLLLGCAAALALIHPILWVVPPIAAVVSAYAIYAINSRPLELAGRPAALAGLALAILFGVSAPVRVVSRQARLYAEARTHADAWLALLREGNLYEAYELHLPARDRQPGSVSLEQLYGARETLTVSPPPGPSQGMMMQNDARQAIRAFFSEPSLKTLVAQGRKAEIIFLGYHSQTYRPDIFTDEVTLQYEVANRENGKSPRAQLNLTLNRVHDAQSRQANWHVAIAGAPAAPN